MRPPYQKLARRDLVQIWLTCVENSGLATADKLIDRIKGTLARTLPQSPNPDDDALSSTRTCVPLWFCLTWCSTALLGLQWKCFE